jgi:hypothetical protein
MWKYCQLNPDPSSQQADQTCDAAGENTQFKNIVFILDALNYNVISVIGDDFVRVSGYTLQQLCERNNLIGMIMNLGGKHYTAITRFASGCSYFYIESMLGSNGEKETVCFLSFREVESFLDEKNPKKQGFIFVYDRRDAYESVTAVKIRERLVGHYPDTTYDVIKNVKFVGNKFLKEAGKNDLNGAMENFFGQSIQEHNFTDFNSLKNVLETAPFNYTVVSSTNIDIVNFPTPKCIGALVHWVEETVNNYLVISIINDDWYIDIKGQCVKPSTFHITGYVSGEEDFLNYLLDLANVNKRNQFDGFFLVPPNEILFVYYKNETSFKSATVRTLLEKTIYLGQHCNLRPSIASLVIAFNNIFNDERVIYEQGHDLYKVTTPTFFGLGAQTQEYKNYVTENEKKNTQLNIWAAANKNENICSEDFIKEIMKDFYVVECTTLKSQFIDKFTAASTKGALIELENLQYASAARFQGGAYQYFPENSKTSISYNNVQALYDHIKRLDIKSITFLKTRSKQSS